MRLALTLFLLTTAAYGESFDGWRGLKWGATKADALDLYKADGARENAAGVELPYKIGDDAFTAQLSFTDNGLNSVTLNPLIGEAKGDSKESIRKMDALIQMGIRINQLLEEKYGNPSKSAHSRSAPPEMIDDWYLDGGNISFYCAFEMVKDLPYRLRLTYSRKKAALDKL